MFVVATHAVFRCMTFWTLEVQSERQTGVHNSNTRIPQHCIGHVSGDQQANVSRRLHAPLESERRLAQSAAGHYRDLSIAISQLRIDVEAHAALHQQHAQEQADKYAGGCPDQH